MMTDRLIINGDRTVIDSETLLMWTVSEFGMSTNGIICEGMGGGFTWQEAYKLFGRGRDIPPYYPPAPDGGRNFEKELTEQTYKGYKFNKTCPVYVGGYNDWRLPTVEEIWTLVHTPNDYGRLTVNTEVFGESREIWTATRSGRVGSGGTSAWSLGVGMSLNFDEPISRRFHVRLVRLGSVFNSIYSKHPHR